MELMNGDDIVKLLEKAKDNTHKDELIVNLIRDGDDYAVLEKIIDGTLDKKFIKIMLPIKEKSSEWERENFYTCLEIGVMDGALELSDIVPVIERDNSFKYN